MFFKKSKNSALYFFLLFVFGLFAVSLYKSIYAVLSPAQLQAYLENKLQKEVDLKKIELSHVNFHFFHRYFFRPSIEWQNLDLSYIKNCNRISLSSPSLFIELDIGSIFQKKIRIKEINSSFIDFQILRNYDCETLSENEKTVLPTAKLTTTIDGPSSPTQEMEYVDDLPSFDIKTFKLSTERNPSRYYIFDDLKIDKDKNKYEVVSDLSFSNGTGLGFLPKLKLEGLFDSFYNIELKARLREASLQVRVEPIGEKNYKTSIFMEDFPLKYILRGLNPDIEASALSTHWLDLKAYTISHWDDFFAKRIPLQIEDFRIVGEDLKLFIQPFTYHLKNQALIKKTQVQVERMDFAVLQKIWPDLYKRDDLPLKGIWQGRIDLIAFEDLNPKAKWEGNWQNFTWLLPYGKNQVFRYDQAKSAGFYENKNFKEELTNIINNKNKIEGFHRYSKLKGDELIREIELKSLANDVVAIFEKSKSLNIYALLEQNTRLIKANWQGVKDEAFQAAKVDYRYQNSTDKIKKTWIYENLVFNKENTFLNALSRFRPGLIESKALQYAKRESLKQKEEKNWQVRWEIELTNPRQKIFLENKSLSDWHVIRSIPEVKMENLAFQDDLFPNF